MCSDRIPVAREETAMEYWVSGCICLVFAALSEYAFILFKMIKIKRRRRRARDLAEKYREEERESDDDRENKLFGRCPEEENQNQGAVARGRPVVEGMMSM